jgi:parallel beta-helix repeat protein
VAPDGALETRIDPARLPRGVLDLHLDGHRLEPARWPDPDPGDLRSGWLRTAPGTEGSDGFRTRPADLAGIGVEPGLRALLYDARQWTTNLVRIARLDGRSGRVELADNVAWHKLGPGTPWRLQGSRRFLDRPGEWYHDPVSGTLALRPPAGRLPAGHRLVAATLDTLLHLERVEDVTIAGLVLADGSPHGSDRAPPYLQIGGGAIRAEAGRGLRLCGNTLRNVGVGIALLEVEDALVAGNSVAGTAGNGIHVGLPWGGRPSRRVRIEDNRIEDVGHRFVESAGILLQGVVDAVVTRNRIERSSGFGIYGMQARANGEDRIGGLRIERNRIHAANLRTADGGGIKLFTAVQDELLATTIRANWVDGTTHLMMAPGGRFFAPDEYDVRRWPQPIAPAIYLDWYASGVTVEGNLLTGNYAGVSIVNGSANRIAFNRILGGAGAALDVDNKTPETRGRPPMAGNRIEANLVLRDRSGSVAVHIWDLAGEPGAVGFARNLYGGPALGVAAFVAEPRRLPGGRGAGGLEAWRGSLYVTGEEQLIRVGPGEADLRALALDPAGRAGIPPLDPWLVEQLREAR